MKIKSIKGHVIDMAALMANNASTVALGNANMNARGDLVDRHGRVLKSREVVVQEYYNHNPKAVTKVSLRDLGDEVLTPAQAIEKLEGKKAAPPKVKRKLVDLDD